jgi:hypothetical protein
MATTQDFWRPIINDFNPVGEIRPDEVARFFVDRKENDPQRSRVQRLKLSFLNAQGQAKPYKALLTGHIGSGKSSELMRLGQEMANDFFVVWFDADLSLAIDTANHFDVLMGMGLAIYATAEAAQLKPDKRLAQKLIDSLAKFVETQEGREEASLKLSELLKQVFAITFVAGAGALGGPPAALVAGAFVVGANEILKTTRLELNVSDKLVKILELPPNRQEVIGALNQIIEQVSRKAQKPLLIITDGLDKISATRARVLFASSTLLTEPASALIYAAPVELYHRLPAGQAKNLFNEFKILPNLPVHQRPPTGENWQVERTPNEEGLKVMRRVVAKRLEAHNKSPDEVITPEALGLMTRMSGGVMRQLIHYFQEAATSAQSLKQLRINEAMVQGVIDEHRLEITPQLSHDHSEALRRVLQQGKLGGGQQEALEDDLLHSVHLLSYQDDRHFWFDAHPNVLPLL